MHRAIFRRTAVMGVAVAVCLSAPSAGAQPATADLVLTTRSGPFTMPPLPSLVTDDMVLDAGRRAKLALAALDEEARSLATAIDTIDDRIAANAAAMEKANETLAAERLTLQPAIDAYTREQSALEADDAQLVRDQAPVQALIAAYTRTPLAARRADEYDRIAALKAPLDERSEALKTRKTALQARYEAIDKALSEQERPLAAIKALDLELLAERKVSTTALREAFRQLKAGYEYTLQVERRLRKVNVERQEVLTPILESANELLQLLGARGFEAATP